MPRPERASCTADPSSPANIASFMREPDVDGALVGGASLVVDEFAAIVRYQKHVGV